MDIIDSHLYCCSSKDRFVAHKHWEGRELPLDSSRPVSNLYHQKLLIAVDWEYLCPIAPPSLSSTGPIMGEVGVISTNQEATTVASWMRNAGSGRTEGIDSASGDSERINMDHRIVDHSTYTSLCLTQAAPQQSSTGAGATTTRHHLGGEIRDGRVGLTLNDVVARFLDPEEIDYKCERCNAMQKVRLCLFVHHVCSIPSNIVEWFSGHAVHVASYPSRSMHLAPQAPRDQHVGWHESANLGQVPALWNGFPTLHNRCVLPICSH